MSFGSDGSGTFSSSGSCTVSAGSCPVTYTPSAVGSGTHKVTASYGGDAAHTSSNGSTGVSVASVPTGGGSGSGGGPGTPMPTAPAGTPPPSSAAAVTLTQIAQSHSVGREGNALATLTRKAKNTLPVGTTFWFVLNEQANVGLTFTQTMGGRKIKGRCVTQSRKNRKNPVCQLVLTKGILTVAAQSGRNVVSFQGQISASSKLTPGRYAVVIVARAAGGASTPNQLSFTITK